MRLSRRSSTLRATYATMDQGSEKTTPHDPNVLVAASIENWRSFKDRIDFSMVAGRQRQHGHRVPRIGRFRTRLLPVAAIFGGNAAGKTNFFRALSFAKSLVVAGTSQLGKPIPVEPFRLDEESETRPSRFSFDLLIDDAIHSYSFSVTATKVEYEELCIQTNTMKKIIYIRKGEEIEFHRSLARIDKLNMAFSLTRPNQLFLTSSLAYNLTNFHSTYRWFDECLELMAPDCRFAPLEYMTRGHPFHISTNEVLSRLDLGVSRLDTEEVRLESILSEELVAGIQSTLKLNQSGTVRFGDSSRHIVTRHDGGIKAQKLVTYHRRGDGSEVKFEFRDESDGSRRVIDLLPAFLDLASSGCNKTYVIDELDRSLHPILTRWLLEYFLDRNSQQSRSQLLFSTNDVQLIDQSLFRLDEMWVTETDREGVSQLISFGEYRDVRKDRDIRKSYLQGRLGGIPRIFA